MTAERPGGPGGTEGDLAGIAALADPVRRALHRYVGGRCDWVTREEAAAATGLAHHVVKLNLDRLAVAGLLESGYQRPPGRSGPGAGRPAKVYRRADREFAVSVPARRYELAAGILANGVRRSIEDGTPVAEAVRDTATDAGRALGRAAADRASTGTPVAAAIREVLDGQGFATRAEGSVLHFGNCPFAGLLHDCKRLICTMNGSLVRGLLAASGATALTAQLAPPPPGDCCVTVHGVG